MKGDLEGNLNFNTWKAEALNTLEEHILDSYISTVVKEPTYNVGCIKFKKNQAKFKQFINYSMKDDLMTMITLLKNKGLF